MPLHQLREADGDLLLQLPVHLQRVWLSNLQPGLDSANSYILGVAKTYNVKRLGTGQRALTMLLEETVSEGPPPAIRIINTLFFGKLAEDCITCVRQGSKLALLGFTCSKSSSTSENGHHGCQLELLDENAAKVYVQVRSLFPAAVQARSSASKQKYTLLNQLTLGSTVIVFGVVKFFKTPEKSKGTDFYSTVTIVDQTDVQLKCVLFSGNKDALPEIYKKGDLIIVDKLKIQEFNNEKQGVANAIVASVTFDGTPGEPIVARTRSKDFHLTQEDLEMVVMLRSWASRHLAEPTVMLSSVTPFTYFDLACQLLAKAQVADLAFLIKVWDGTRCPFPNKDIAVKDEVFEGDALVVHERRDLTIDIMVYDEHIEAAKSLQIGSYLLIHNLNANILPGQPEHLRFQLHGGRSYGRGIIELPENHYDVQQLKQRLDSVDLLNY